jgi:beta-lactamase superfamily II metal-dependent hydrolase
MTMSASLEIHQINVGQGDAILIINRDLATLATAVASTKPKPPTLERIDLMPYAVKCGTDNPTKPNILLGTVKKAVLIDGGDDMYGEDVAAYLEALGVATPDTPFCDKLSLVATHYHDDHIAGLRSVFKKLKAVPVLSTSKAGPGKKKAVVTKVKEVARYRPAHVYYTAPAPKQDPLTSRLTAFRTDIDEAATQTANPTTKHPIDPGGLENGAQLVVDLGTGVDNIPIRLLAFAASQGVYQGLSVVPKKSKTKPVPRVADIASTGKTPDQNDRSIVFILEYGSFRYFLGGDIAGNGGAAGGNGAFSMNTAAKKSFSVHADVESTLGPALEKVLVATKTPMAGSPKFKVAGHCTALKANHHASSSSMDIHLLATLKPKVAIITSGVKARFHSHPTQEVLDRMNESPNWEQKDGATTPNTLDGMYVNEVADKYKGKTFSSDLKRAKIFGDMIIRPVDETIKAIQDATAFGTKLKVQVYGTGILTALDTTTTTLRATTTAPVAEMYPIGPVYHECDQH